MEARSGAADINWEGDEILGLVGMVEPKKRLRYLAVKLGRSKVRKWLDKEPLARRSSIKDILGNDREMGLVWELFLKKGYGQNQDFGLNNRILIVDHLSDGEEDFDTIYHLALNDDEELLDLLLMHDACINVLNEQLFTPAGKLASEGEHDAVKLLLRKGADVSHAAMGYASGGFVDKAENLRRNHPISLEMLLRGANMCAAKPEYAVELKKTYGLQYGSGHAVVFSHAHTQYAYFGQFRKLKVHYLAIANTESQPAFVESMNIYADAYTHAMLNNHQPIVKYLAGCLTTPVSICGITIAHALVREGHFKRAWEIYNDTRFTSRLVFTGITREIGAKFFNKNYALYHLSSINDEKFLRDLAQHKHIQMSFPDLKSWVETAIFINKVRRDYSLDYDQAKTVVAMYSVLDTYSMRTDEEAVTLAIADTLADSRPQWPLEENQPLADVAQLIEQKKWVVKKLQDYVDSKKYYYLGGDHTARAISLQAAAREVKTQGELTGLLQMQLLMFSPASNVVATEGAKKHERPLVNKNQEEGYYELINTLAK